MKTGKIINKNEKFIIFILLLILTLQIVLSSYYISPTADEMKHLTRGYVYLKTGDQRFNNVHPILINSLNAIPLLLIKGINLPLQHESWINNNVINFATQFFFHSGNDLERMFLLGRITTFILSIILGILVYLWAKKLYGIPSGLFALFLYALSVNIIAYSALVTNDLGGTFFIFLSIYTLWLFYKNPSLKNLLLSGFVFGLALMSKYYTLHFVPSIVALIIIAYYKNKNGIIFYRFRKGAKTNNMLNMLLMITLFFFISWIAINISYKFDGTFRSIEYNVAHDPGLDKNMYSKIIENSASLIPLKKEQSLKFVNFVASNVPIMMPYHYMKGILYSADVTLERSAKQFYFFEKIYDKPPRYYYLVMFSLKVQIPLLMFLFLTLIFYKKIKKSYIDDYFILIPVIIFAVLFSLNPVANGFRHFLPIFPFLFVFISKLPNVILKNKRGFNYLILVLIIWYAITPLMIFPFYIPYYNEFVGMDNGYKVSINVDVDWGQDLKFLKRFMDEKGIKHIGLSYFGQVYPEYYNISYTYLPSIGTYKYKGVDTPLNEVEDCTPYKGIVAISIANLEQPFLFKNESCFDWLKGLEPIHRVGYSIYIFNVSNIG